MRLDKYLADAQVDTRSAVKKLIKKGLIKINGNIIKDCGFIVKEHDKITYLDQEIVFKKYIYIMLNKPKGYVTSTKDESLTVMDLLQEYKLLNLFPVGRLDKDTEGLLLITNDGEIAHNLTSPNHHVDKLYYVELAEAINNETIELFNKGLLLKDGYFTKPAVLKIISSKSCYVTIKEGKYHQIKRMFASIKNKVLYLKRLKFGLLELDNNLLPGEYRLLTEEEIKKLHSVKHSS